MTRLLSVVGNRPQFVKIAAILKTLKANFSGEIEHAVIHSGQHYDHLMNDIFFQEFNLDEPFRNLQIGSGPLLDQIGAMMKPMREAFQDFKPDGIITYGDTNTTLAAALSAAHLSIPLFHFEGGERIFRRREVPEEINRVLTDQVSWVCYTATEKATRYLRREGFHRDRAVFVGDLMFDIFLQARSISEKIRKRTSYDLEPQRFILATIHRAENTNDDTRLINIVQTLDNMEIPVLLPAHPRLANRLNDIGWEPKKSLIVTEPLGYFDFQSLLLDCKMVFTDSGGVSREAYFAGKPCIVSMADHWWPEIVEAGWAIASSAEGDKLMDEIDHFLLSVPSERPPLFGAGDAGFKMLQSILEFLSVSPVDGHWHSVHQQLPKAEMRFDFTHRNYRDFLATFATNEYRYIGLQEANIMPPETKRSVFLRHDIDFSLRAAVEMAEIEHEMGITATYFIMLQSEHYSPFTFENKKHLLRILELGHQIGLHFDNADHCKTISIEEINKNVNIQADMLANWVGTVVEVVSFHRPDAIVLKGAEELTYPRLHTYSKKLAHKLTYFSDSRGDWKLGHPFDSNDFKEGKSMQVLVHPIWWNENPLSALETLDCFIDNSTEGLRRSVSSNCSVYPYSRKMR